MTSPGRTEPRLRHPAQRDPDDRRTALCSSSSPRRGRASIAHADRHVLPLAGRGPGRARRSASSCRARAATARWACGRSRSRAASRWPRADVDATALTACCAAPSATGWSITSCPSRRCPRKLVDYHRHLHEVAPRKDGDGSRGTVEEHLARDLRAAARRTGHDFSDYKDSTLVRRMQRRMQVLQHRRACPTYIERLRKQTAARSTRCSRTC